MQSCGKGRMNSATFGLKITSFMRVSLICFLFGCWSLFAFSAAAQNICTLRLDMFDSHGDGWNGGFLVFQLNGIAVDTFVLDKINGDGRDSSVYFMAPEGQTMTFVWYPGLYPSEASFKIFDADDAQIFTTPNYLLPIIGVYRPGVVRCPKCLKVSSLRLDNVWDTRARLRWTPATAEAGTQWRVIFGPAGFIPGPGRGDTLTTTTPQAMLTGLEKKKKYHVFVEQHCPNGFPGKIEGPLAFETRFSNDLGIAAVLSPRSACQSPGPDTVRVLLHNFGANPQTLFQYNFSVDGSAPIAMPPHDGLFTNILGKDSSFAVAFETIIDFKDPGEHVITIYTSLKNDEDPGNDTLHYYFTTKIAPPYRQDFEQWAGAWTPDTAGVRNTWAYGKPDKKGITRAANGQYAWVTNLTAPLPATDQSYLVSPCFDFSGTAIDPAISFSLLYDNSPPADGGFLEISLDGGATWQKTGGGGLNWYPAKAGGAWTGRSNGWITAKNSLKGAAGNSNVRLRFSHRTFGGTAQVPGMGIDDIRIFVPETQDMSGLRIKTAADNNICGLMQDSILFQCANFGLAPQANYSLAYSINGGPAVIEPVQGTLAPDSLYTHRFSVPFDSRGRLLTIRCWPIAAGDALPFNDTVFYTIDHRAVALPFYENFESGVDPAGWAVAPNSEITGDHHNQSYVLAVNLYSSAGNQQFVHDMPLVGPIEADDTLSFDYRFTQFNSDSTLNGTLPFSLSGGNRFLVKISVNCGQTFQTLVNINGFNHIPTTAMRTRRLPLQAYAGSNAIIRFEGQWGSGDYWVDLDNIALGTGLPPLVDASEAPLPILDQVQLYPNPTNGSFTITGQLGTAAPLQLSVFSPLGQCVVARSLPYATDLQETVDLSGQPEGLYRIRIAGGRQVVSRTVVKMR